LLASGKLVANKLDIVCAGENNERINIRFAFPMTHRDGIVSPALGPTPASRRRTMQSGHEQHFPGALHQVGAPMRAWPRICARGPTSNTSRLIAVMIGKIMIASTRPPQNMSRR